MADNFGIPGRTVIVNVPCTITETPFSSEVEVQFQIGRFFERHVVPRHKCDIAAGTMRCTARLWDGKALLTLPDGWLVRVDEDAVMDLISNSEAQ